jgi:hypothetical protein
MGENALSQKNEVEIEIFFDEIEPEKDCNYLIIGALFLMTQNKDKIINSLINFRLNKEQKICNLSNTEIHFNKIRESRSSHRQKEISKCWLNFFINNSSLMSAHLYIDLKKLNTSFFGYEKIEANIYNKFFRTVINYGLKCFFKSYDTIKITNIFYDKKGDLERHSFFNNFNFDKLRYETKDNVKLLGRIIFIDSNHKIEKNYSRESNLIQLIDLILGVIRQNIFYVSKDKLKNEISRIIRPELNKLKQEYWCLKYLKVSFFPKNEIKSVQDLEKNETYERKDEFYYLMDLELKMPSQETNLSNWF